METVLGDLTEREGAARVAERARAWDGQILVNNAGPFVEHDWESAEPEAWQDTLNANVISAVRLIQALVPQMRERGWGRVINIGSTADTVSSTAASPECRNGRAPSVACVSRGELGHRGL